MSLYSQVVGHFDAVAVVVQSSRHPGYVQSRISNFLRNTQLELIKVRGFGLFSQTSSLLFS